MDCHKIPDYYTEKEQFLKEIRRTTRSGYDLRDRDRMREVFSILFGKDSTIILNKSDRLEKWKWKPSEHALQRMDEIIETGVKFVSYINAKSKTTQVS